jgi:UDP-glucuronate 4-epimerase
MQQGDVLKTFASTGLLEKYAGYRPETSIEKGLEHFIKWYREYGRKIQ